MGCLCPNSKKVDEAEENEKINLGGEVSVESFRVLKVVGRGTYGKVVLVEKKGTGEFFAMKILKKQVIKEKNQRGQTLTERKILVAAKCPFVVRMHYALQDRKNLYMVMEYLSGGELFFHLSQQGVFSELRARFYLSEIIMGLEYLHSNNIIYRDLKPENVVLDSQGHIRLTDFGLSKGYLPTSEKTNTFCGTAEYLAPEIILHSAYDKSVDFWSLGALLYYMLSGAPPHYNKNKAQIFKDVLTKPIEPILSATNAANDLLNSLLKINPMERLTDMQVLKQHEWFKGLDWDAAYSLKTDPPFRPRVKNPGDTNNFDKIFTSERTEDTVESLQISTPGGHYSGFTYKDVSRNSGDSKRFN